MTRAKTKGEKSVGAFGAAAAKILGLLPIISCNQGVTSSVAKVRGAAAARSYVLDLTRREPARGLLSPYINLSFSGSTDTVAALPAYTRLHEEAKHKGVTVSLQEMSPTNAINLGPDALTAGFVAQAHSATW